MKNRFAWGWLAVCLAVVPLSAMSQSRTGFMAGFGLIRYNGDVGKLKNRIIDPIEVVNLYGKAGLCYRLGGHTEATLSFLHGTLEDADSLSDNTDQLARNQSFKTPMDELSLQFEFSLFDLTNPPRANPYLSAGAGVFKFKPRGFLGGGWHELQPLGTEGQNIDETIYAKPYALTEFSFIFGGGISFYLAPSWRLKLEAAYHLTTTDYLDDVSTIYPDSTQLANTPNGALAVLLSNRRLDPVFPPVGRSRGNANSKDSFIHIGLTLVFNPAGNGSGNGGLGGARKIKGKKRTRKADRCPAFDS